jgi:hypothetical protein
LKWLSVCTDCRLHRRTCGFNLYEITTDAIATDATALATAQTSALSSNTSAQTLLDKKFNLFFLVGG